MCKVLILSNTSQIQSLEKVTEKIADLMSFSERDGFGYVIQGKKGLYGERSTNIDDFKVDFKSKIISYPFLSPDYERINNYSKPVGAGLFHGRTSTNNKTLVNTHPITKHEWTLIHNGVVSNHGPNYNMITTNDTEHLVHYLANGGVSEIEKHITGYYAIGAIDPSGKLHVIKDDKANLNFAYIENINSYVFATTQSLISDLCAQFKWKCSRITPVKNNIYLIIENNEIISMNEIKPRGTTEYENKFSGLSLGRDINDNYPWGEAQVFDLTQKKSVKLVTETDFTQDEILFLDEVNTYADSSYVFKDYNGRDINLSEFKQLTDEEKLYCTVIRADGTIVDPIDYSTDKLWTG